MRKSSSSLALTRDQTVTRELTPAGNNDTQTESVSIASALEELSEIPESLIGTRDRDELFNLHNLKLDQGRVDVFVPAVEVGEDLPGFFGTSLCV